MKGIRSHLKSKSWKKLMSLFKGKGPVNLKKLSQDLKQSEAETLSFIKQVFRTKNPLKTFEKENHLWLDLDHGIEKKSLPLTTSEWVLLQQLLNDSGNNASLSELGKKVMNLTPVKIDVSLLKEINEWSDLETDIENELAAKLDELISDSQSALLHMHDGKDFGVFPKKVMHLEGSLTLIAEEAHDHTLQIYAINEVEEINEFKTEKSSIKTEFEVEEFIAAIRSMGDKETRLILKIHNPDEVNLFPEHHFLGKPCMITNANGDLIWAAYVEPCNALFDWLSDLGKHVEILDPIGFKEEYLAYCEEKLRKIA